MSVHHGAMGGIFSCIDRKSNKFKFVSNFFVDDIHNNFNLMVEFAKILPIKIYFILLFFNNVKITFIYI